MSKEKKKNKLPLVSVIIPVYNGEKYMREAIDSALAQTYENVEVIVVNDGSTDRTDEIAKSYGDEIRYFRKENGGASSALNFGIKKMQGDYFAWLSCDDRYLPEKIERAVATIPDNNEKAIVFTNFALIDENGKRYAETKFENRVDLELFSKDIYPVEKGTVNGDTILIHKSIFDECGLFDESSRTVGDYEMWLRIFDKYEHVFSTDCLTEYRIHPEQDTQKSPVYNAESDELAIKRIELITEKRAKEWGISLFQIYMDLYMQFKKAGFKKATKLAFKLGKDRFKKDDLSLSVLMPAHNSEKYIEEAILSLLDSDFGDFELIVVDDGSTDKTRATVEKLAKKDFRIKLITNSKNLGAAKSLNKALEIARGKYMTRLDSDDTMLPDRLTKQMLVFNAKNVKLVGTNINFMDELGAITRERVYGPLVAPCRFASLFTNPIPNATIAYDMEIVRKHNLRFDEVVVSEDYAFLLKFLEFGDGVMIDEGLYNYRIREDSLFHTNKDFAKVHGREICEEYGKKILPKFSDGALFKFINGFETTAIKLDDRLLGEFINEGEQTIETAGRKFGFSDEQKNQCRVFLFKEIYNRCAAVTPAENGSPAVKRGPLGKIYHYYLDNGARKTIRKVLTLGRK